MTSVDTVAATTMRVVCGKDELAETLQVVGRGVSTRTTVQILAGIMLRAAGGRLHLSATDMEVSIRNSLEAQVEEEGAVVVPGRLLVDIVRLLPAGEVTLEHRADEGMVRLTCGRTRKIGDREDLERRADDEEQRRLLGKLDGAQDRALGQQLVEEDDVGLEDRAAGRARRSAVRLDERLDFRERVRGAAPRDRRTCGWSRAPRRRLGSRRAGAAGRCSV